MALIAFMWKKLLGYNTVKMMQWQRLKTLFKAFRQEWNICYYT